MEPEQSGTFLFSSSGVCRLPNASLTLAYLPACIAGCVTAPSPCGCPPCMPSRFKTPTRHLQRSTY
jgi:hypothetical protein